MEGLTFKQGVDVTYIMNNIVLCLSIMGRIYKWLHVMGWVKTLTQIAC
jgi:hypothetical protein